MWSDSTKLSSGHAASRRIGGTDEEACWKAIISQVTWMVCRKFQFQAFNYIDKNGKGTLRLEDAAKCIPATAFLVSDHLSQLIITDGMSREDCAVSPVGFGNAVWRLHVTIFTPYEAWAAHEHFEPFYRLMQSRSMFTEDPAAILAGLLDLCTFFCLWTEASTLRHMPESLWFFFWTMQQSYNFSQVHDTLVGEHGTHIWRAAFDGRNELTLFSDRRLELRKTFHKTILAQRRDAKIFLPANTDRQQYPRADFDNLLMGSPDFRSDLVNWSAISDAADTRNLSPRDQALLWDLVLFGDGGAFVDRIVTPVFRALAHEVSTKGGKGVEPAMRITYDDANECFVLPQNVRRIIRDVGGDLNRPGKGELFYKLWVLGDGNDGFDADRATRWYTCGHGDSTLRPGEPPLPWLVKTFQERRTWFATYLAYYRIFAFHILWFHGLLALAFAQDPDDSGAGFVGRWWLGMSSAIITHAFLEVLYCYGMLYTRFRVPAPPAGQMDVRKQVIKNETKVGALASVLCCCAPRFLTRRFGLEYERRLTDKECQEGASDKLWKVEHIDRVSQSVYGLSRHAVALCGWMLVLLALWFFFAAQFSSFPWPVGDPDPFLLNGKLPAAFFKDVWEYVACIYVLIAVVVWGPLTQRDGYVITPSTLYASLTQRRSQTANGTGNKVFQKGSQHLRGEYLASVPPKVGWSQFFRNVVFWSAVVTLKFCVDYLLIVKHLPDPIRGLLRQNWLGTCGDDLVIGSSNVPCIENMVLVGALCLPIFLVVQFDTGLLYQVVVFAYGCTNGLVVLGLGQVVTWNDLVKQFERGVEQFNKRLLSWQATESWSTPRKIQEYYQMAFKGTGSTATDDKLPALALLNDEQTREYQKWTPFADVWDSIILDLRLSDLISNEEEANLRFHAVHFLRKHDLKPHVLPVCFFAGKIQRALDEGSVDTLGVTILKEAFLLFLALLTEIGLVSTLAQETLRTLSFVNQPQNYYHNSVRKRIVSGVKAVITTLSKLVQGADVAMLKKQLISDITALCEDTLIELHYSQLLLPKQSDMVSQHISTIHNILEGEPTAPVPSSLQVAGTHRQRSSLLRVHDGNKHKLAVAENSLLDRTMTAMCARQANAAGVAHARSSGPHDSDGGAATDKIPVLEIRTLLKVLQQAMSLTDQQSEPKNEEASRVLKFFMSTLLNGSMKAPQPLHQMRSLTTLVPHYAEGVIYPLDSEEVAARIGDEVKKGDLGDELVEQMSGLDVSTIDFLRIQFRDEWDNFVQRIIGKYGVQGAAAHMITERDFRISEGGLFSELPEARMDLMLWASERGQMLSRTVKGMMMYGSALQQLELLEAPDATLLRQSSAADGKFTHIVSSQVYGSKKASSKPADKWLALSVDHLMQKYPALRIAYIDTARSVAPGGKGTPMSVLLRWNADEEEVQECYRVRLPDQREDGRGVILGEGKPENQNHAMIFCFSESIQTVDMNQENHLAEAFKMRNLLQEFAPRHNQFATGRQQVGTYRDVCHVLAKKEPIVALVGFREWIFSGKAGTLGQFAAGAEFAFGTIVQRTMAEPGGARFHYGHPDVWNKLFTMTRGGVSKATRAFHISEDVFGGYNAIFRGAVIKYKEYISVGKARDVGFAQINGFEAKVSGGNGEQSISRDVHRLGARLDWFRLMSWYHSGIGFFINSTLTMSSVYLAVWLVFLFSLTDSLTVRAGSADRANALADEASLISTVNTVQLFQLGLLSVIPYWGELCLETGFLEGTIAILRQALAGSFLFFIFRQQTSAYYFTQIVYYGGAKYIATGRGFDLTHTPYVKHYESFGRSHILFGFQLGLMATMLAFLGVPSYAMSTWGTWLVALSLTASPFWFNPATFRVNAVLEDFNAWRKWLAGSVDASTGNSWTIFHRSQLEKARNVEGKQTDHGWNQAAGILMQVFNVVILVALVENILRPDQVTVIDPDTGVISVKDSDQSLRDKIIGFAVFEFVLVAIIVMLTVARLVKAQGANVRRYISVFTGVSLVCLIIFYVARVGGTLSAGFTDIVLLAFANMTAFVIVVQVCLYGAPYQRWSITIVDAGYYAADTAIGLTIFLVLFLLSIVPLVDSLQALLLFSSELLVESRKGAQLRLFDAKRGQLRAAAQTALPLRPPNSQGSGISSHPTFMPTVAPADVEPVLMSPPAGAAIKPSFAAASRVVHSAAYGTLGAQMTLTAAHSTPLAGLRARKSGSGNGGRRPRPSNEPQ